MVYPDFSYYFSTQIILFFVNCTVMTMSYYWGANIILQIYQKLVSFKRKILFSIIAALLLHILVGYGVSLLNGIAHQIPRLYAGSFKNLINNMLPFSYIILYLLGVKILNLSSYTSIKIMFLSYIYFICCTLVLRIVGNVFFPMVQDPMKWNYLRDIYKLITSVVIIFVFYQSSLFFINKYKLYILFSDNIIVYHIKCELLKNFCICSVIYLVIFISYYLPVIDDYHWFLMLFILIGYIVICICQDYIRIYQGSVINRDEHIISLNQSIEEFRGIRHDFNNILQSYSGYLMIEDYTELRLYHEKITNTIVSAGIHLDMSQRIWENPSFFSLIISKLKEAQKKNIIFEECLVCNMQNIYIEELDFNRVMAVLLDNAIEEAEQTVLRRVKFSGQQKPDGSKLFILENDTRDDVLVEEFFTPGFTTKKGHMGQGLVHVRDILHTYGNTMFDMSYYKGTTTVYLELKPAAKQGK